MAGWGGGGGGVGVVCMEVLLLKCCFTSTETVGLLGTGAQDVHLDFHTAPELCMEVGCGGIIYLSLQCHQQNDSCVKMGIDESHFKCFMNCEGQSHKTVSANHNPFKEKRAESVSNRGLYR